MARLQDVILASTLLLAGCSGTPALVGEGPIDSDSAEDTFIDTQPTDAPACVAGASTSELIGPSGGMLEWCGASIFVPAGAFVDFERIGIGIFAPSIEPPSGRAFASPFFHFSPDDRVLPTHVLVTLPHDGEPGRKEILRLSGDRSELVQPRDLTQIEVRIEVQELGSFVVLRDRNVYPTAP